MRRRYFERFLRKCPVCGTSRRAGYVRCCRGCAGFLAWYGKCNGILVPIRERMVSQGFRLSWRYFLGTITIKAEKDGPMGLVEGEKVATVGFGSRVELNKWEMERAMSPDDILVNVCRNLATNVERSINESKSRVLEDFLNRPRH